MFEIVLLHRGRVIARAEAEDWPAAEYAGRVLTDDAVREHPCQGYRRALEVRIIAPTPTLKGGTCQ